MHQTIKFLASSLLAILTVASTALLWREHSSLLVFVLLAIAFLMLWVDHERDAIALYVIVFVLGPLAEAVVIIFGAWSYADPYVVGVSIWLPFIWGNAGLYIRRISRFVHWISVRKILQ